MAGYQPLNTGYGPPTYAYHQQYHPTMQQQGHPSGPLYPTMNRLHAPQPQLITPMGQQSYLPNHPSPFNSQPIHGPFQPPFPNNLAPYHQTAQFPVQTSAANNPNSTNPSSYYNQPPVYGSHPGLVSVVHSGPVTGHASSSAPPISTNALPMQWSNTPHLPPKPPLPIQRQVIQSPIEPPIEKQRKDAGQTTITALDSEASYRPDFVEAVGRTILNSQHASMHDNLLAKLTTKEPAKSYGSIERSASETAPPRIPDQALEQRDTVLDLRQENATNRTEQVLPQVTTRIVAPMPSIAYTMDTQGMREAAMNALKHLHSYNVDFRQLKNENLDNGILRKLYEEMNIQASANANEPATESAHTHGLQKVMISGPEEVVIGSSLIQPVAEQFSTSNTVQDLGTPAQSSIVTAQGLSNSHDRQDYVAKLLAAKGGRGPSVSTDDRPESKLLDNPAHTQSADESPSQEARGLKETVINLEKMTIRASNVKAIAQTELVKKKLEALRQATMAQAVARLSRHSAAESEIPVSENAPPSIKSIEISKSTNEGRLNVMPDHSTPVNSFFALPASPIEGLPGLPGLLPPDELSSPQHEAAGQGEISSTPAQGTEGPLLHQDKMKNDHSSLVTAGEVEAESEMVDAAVESVAEHPRLDDKIGNSPVDKEQHAESPEPSPSYPNMVRQMDPVPNAYSPSFNLDDTTNITLKQNQTDVTNDQFNNDKLPDEDVGASAAGAAALHKPFPRPEIKRSKSLAAHEEEIRLFKQRIRELEERKRLKKEVSTGTTSATLQAQPEDGTDPVSTEPEMTNAALDADVGNSAMLLSMGSQVVAQQKSLEAARTIMENRLQAEESASAAIDAVVESAQHADADVGSLVRQREQHDKEASALRKKLQLLQSQIVEGDAHLDILRQRQKLIEDDILQRLASQQALKDELETHRNSLGEEGSAATRSGASESKAVSRFASLVEPGSALGVTQIRTQAMVKQSSTAELAVPSQINIMPEVDYAQAPSPAEVQNATWTGSASSAAASSAQPDESPLTPGEESGRSPYSGPEYESAQNGGIEDEDDGNDYEPQLEGEQEEYEPAFSPQNYSPAESGVHGSDADSAGEEYEPYFEPEEDADHSDEVYDPDAVDNVQGSTSAPLKDTATYQFDAPFQHVASELESMKHRKAQFTSSGTFLPNLNSTADHITMPDAADSPYRPRTVPTGDYLDGNNTEGAFQHEANHGDITDNTPTAFSIKPGDSVEQALTGGICPEQDPGNNTALTRANYLDSANLPAKLGDADNSTYNSPLRIFKAYRFHPQFLQAIAGGYGSRTFSNQLRHDTIMCPIEIENGNCSQTNCGFQHFRDMGISDNQLLMELGSTKEGRTTEERDHYISGLKTLIQALRQRGADTNSDLIATEIIAYRARFMFEHSGDDSHFITHLDENLA